MTTQRGERLIFSLLAFAFGASFCVVLAYAALRKEPINEPAKFFLLRVLASLSAGGVAAVIPGFFEFQWKKTLQAGGALAVFAIVYLVNPPSLLLPKQDEESPYIVEESTLVFDLSSVTQPIEPTSVVMDRFDIVRRNPHFPKDAGPYIIRCGTNGAGIKAVSITHPEAVFEEVNAAPNAILPKPLKHVYTLTIPQNSFSTQPVLVHNRITFVDSFVNSKDEWVALQTKYPTQLASLVTILPQNRPFQRAEVVCKYSTEAMEKVAADKTVKHSHSNHLLHTCIADMRAGDAIGIRFDW